MKHLVSAVALALAALASGASAQAPTYSGLPYATVGPTGLLLDIYQPSNSSGPWPVLIFIHGGGWSGGSRTSIPGPCVLALQHGFAVASIDYRLTSQAALFAPEPVTFPAQIHDVKGAVRWLRANAAAYQLDATRFACMGTSAGGHLSALLATSGGVAPLEGVVGGNLGFSSRVQAAVDFFGPNDLLLMNLDVLTPPGSGIDHDAYTSPESRLLGWDQPGQGIADIRAHLGDPTPPYPALVQLAVWVRPTTWVDASDPPMFIGHGTNDTSVPVKQSTRLSAALFAAGVQHDFRAVPLAGHGLGGPIDAVVVDFLQEQLFGPARPDAGVSFCAGDGSATPCPCGNASLAGSNTGCVHSLFVGANLNAVGTASIASDSLTLRADSMPDGTAIFFEGANVLGGGAGIVFHDGLRCVGAPQRLGTKATQQGWSQYPLAGDLPISLRGAASVGATLNYQVWYRDPVTYCTNANSNLTNALAITWAP